MAIALLAGANGHFAAQGGANGVTSGAVDTTGATCLFLGTNYLAPGSGGVAPAVSDSKGNTWTLIDSVEGSVEGTALYYAANPTVGSGHTFSALATGCYASIGVVAASGVATSSVLDKHNFATAAATSINSAIVGPDSDGQILITCLAAYERSSAPTIDDGFTRLDHLPLIGGTSFDVAMAYQIQTTATNRSPTWSWTTTSAAFSTLATFRAGAAPSGNTVSVPAGGVTWAGQTPTVARTAHQALAVPAGNIAWAAQAPAVVSGSSRVVQIPAANVTWAGLAPAVARTTANLVQITPPANVSWAGQAPAVGQPYTVTGIPAANVTWAGRAPTLVQPHKVLPPAGNIVWAGPAPTVLQGGLVILDTIPRANVTWAGRAPSIFVSGMVATLWRGHYHHDNDDGAYRNNER